MGEQSMQDVDKKRQTAENNLSVEIMQLRKNVQDLQSSSESQDHQSGMRNDIMDMLVESQLLQAKLDLQDDFDRKNVALFGYKGTETMYGDDKGVGGTAKGSKSAGLPDLQSGSTSAR